MPPPTRNTLERAFEPGDTTSTLTSRRSRSRWREPSRRDQRAELQERIVLLALPLADAIARRYRGAGSRPTTSSRWLGPRSSRPSTATGRAPGRGSRRSRPRPSPVSSSGGSATRAGPCDHPVGPGAARPTGGGGGADAALALARTSREDELAAAMGVTVGTTWPRCASAPPGTAPPSLDAVTLSRAPASPTPPRLAVPHRGP